MVPRSIFVLLLPLFLGCAQAPSANSVLQPVVPEATVAPIGEAGETPAADEAASSAVARQIIYRASLVLSVEDFGKAETAIAALIKSTGSYVAQFREDRPYGAQRGGHWTVRVPVPQFERFVEEAGRLGIADQREVQADDVTEECVDLTARLKNKQQLEARLLELVAGRSDEIKDVIALEAELSRVREEIERMQGRLGYLADRVAMTTVEITAYQRQAYRPPEALTFGGRIVQTFRDSVDTLRLVGEAWVLFVVAVLPWLIAILLVVGPFVWWARRRLRKARVQIVHAQPA